MVPIEQRDQYVMQFKPRMGGEQLQPISNSDIIYLEHFLYRTRDYVYSQQIQENLFREKRQKASLRRFEPNQCRICGQLCTESEGFWASLLPWDTSAAHDVKTDSLKYCHFCMDTQTCNNCMAEEKMYIPRELQLEKEPQRRRVCRPAYELLEKYKTVRVDKENPALSFKPELRRLLVLRRIVHKMFDMIKCKLWEEMMAQHGETMFLILRDCYLTFDFICETESLEEELNKYFKKLQSHFK